MPTEFTGLPSTDGTRIARDDGEHCAKCGVLWPRGAEHDCVAEPPAWGPGHAPGPACGGPPNGDGDVHVWFSLTRASYLVWPRSLMQMMPGDWQHRFAELAEEIDATFRAPLPPDTGYSVLVRDAHGRFGRDPLRYYRHGLSPNIEALARDVWGEHDRKP